MNYQFKNGERVYCKSNRQVGVIIKRKYGNSPMSQLVVFKMGRLWIPAHYLIPLDHIMLNLHKIGRFYE